MQGDLTTVARAKAWLAPDSGSLTGQNDPMLQRLVTAVSRLVMNEMGRDTLARRERTDTYNTGMTGSMLLRMWPVLSVESLSLGGLDSFSSSNWTLEPIRVGGGMQRITLNGGRTFGRAVATVTYTTGFVKTERMLVPDQAPYVVPTQSVFLEDEGVVDSDGAAIAHTVDTEGNYTFEAGSAGTEVLVTYAFVPEDIEQAVIHEVGVLSKSRDRIGQASKALPNGAGTVSFLPLRLSDMTRSFLNSYIRVVPL